MTLERNELARVVLATRGVGKFKVYTLNEKGSIDSVAYRGTDYHKALERYRGCIQARYGNMVESLPASATAIGAVEIRRVAEWVDAIKAVVFLAPPVLHPDVLDRLLKARGQILAAIKDLLPV